MLVKLKALGTFSDYISRGFCIHITFRPGWLRGRVTQPRLGIGAVARVMEESTKGVCARMAPRQTTWTYLDRNRCRRREITLPYLHQSRGLLARGLHRDLLTLGLHREARASIQPRDASYSDSRPRCSRTGGDRRFHRKLSNRRFAASAETHKPTYLSI
ncbi:hypothetical protein F4778DRAFT_735342 [Xylariomycetidae sp. FL2044]|nr:hypothetical protein F4778DRAFT_735342 [Xylariomycetidae sp. FL2044]